MNEQTTDDSTTDTPPDRWPAILRALRYRNFRLFFMGQGVSLIGTWMQQIATGWLVYHTLRQSALMLGVVSFCGQIPMLLLSPLAGVYADRWNRHRVLVITQTLSMLQALVIAGLVLGNVITIWQLLPLSILLGCINAFDMPVRQSLFIDMIENREDLGNAIALNSSMVNGARLIGPMVAGLLIASVGEGICFLLNGLSYLAVLASLLMMKAIPHHRSERTKNVLEDIKEGFSYALGFPPVRAILSLIALISLVGVPYSMLMPIFATDVLHGGPHTYGFLSASSGVGALLGALALASRKSVLGLGRRMALAAALFGVGLIIFSLSRNMFLSVVFLIISGFGMITILAASNTVLQTLVDDEMRGRVMSFYGMAFLGMTPFGSLLGGALAHKIGAPRTLMLGGTACTVAAILFARKLPGLKKHIHPIYIRKGILPGTPPSP